MSESVLVARDLARYYEVRDSVFSDKKTLKALDGASFDLAPGQTLAVVGESGCGKSTMARLVTMIEAPTRGELHIDGVDVVGAGDDQKRALRRSVQIVFQDPYGSLNPRKKAAGLPE